MGESTPTFAFTTLHCLFPDASITNYTYDRSLSDFDCGKRLRIRVLLHNVYNPGRGGISPSPLEEVLVQCKQMIGDGWHPHRKERKG